MKLSIHWYSCSSSDTFFSIYQEPAPPPLDEGEELYTEAMALLNSSAPGNRKRAWDMMDEAAALGHVGARVRIAWAKFAGKTQDSLMIMTGCENKIGLNFQ